MNEKEFWQLYNKFMSAPMSFDQLQVFYLASIARMHGCEEHKAMKRGAELIEKFKTWAKKASPNATFFGV